MERGIRRAVSGNQRTNLAIGLDRCPPRRARFRRRHDALPDIILKKDDAILAAIEVFASHAVSRDKERALEAMHIPWLEIRADEALWLSETPWTLDAPLPLHREGPSAAWRCPVHQEQHARYIANKLLQEAEALERARHSTSLLAAKVVDILYKSGSWYRRIYEVREHSTDGHAHALSLVCSEETIVSIGFGSQEGKLTRRQARTAIAAAFETDVEKYEVRAGSDSPMKWARGAVAERLIEHAPWDRTTTNYRPLATRYPRRWQWSEKSKSWWLPEDMKSVTWDRAEDDVNFAEHPAWTRRKQIARERDQKRVEQANSAPPHLAKASLPGSVSLPGMESLWIQVGDSSIFEQASVPLAARLDATEFGHSVVQCIKTGPVVLLELQRSAGQPQRALVLVQSAITAKVVADISAVLKASGVEGAWLAARYCDGAKVFWRFLAKVLGCRQYAATTQCRVWDRCWA